MQESEDCEQYGSTSIKAKAMSSAIIQGNEIVKCPMCSAEAWNVQWIEPWLPKFSCRSCSFEPDEDMMLTQFGQNKRAKHMKKMLIRLQEEVVSTPQVIRTDYPRIFQTLSEIWNLALTSFSWGTPELYAVQYAFAILLRDPMYSVLMESYDVETVASMLMAWHNDPVLLLFLNVCRPGPVGLERENVIKQLKMFERVDRLGHWIDQTRAAMDRH